LSKPEKRGKKEISLKNVKGWNEYKDAASGIQEHHRKTYMLQGNRTWKITGMRSTFTSFQINNNIK